MRHLVRLLLAVLALLTVALVLGSDSVAERATRTITLHDHRSGLALTMETHPLAPNVGRFVFWTGAELGYRGLARADVRHASAASVIARYDGEAQLFSLADGIRGQLRVRLEARIDPTRNAGEATLWTDQRPPLHLVAVAPSTQGLDAALGRVESALKASDWGALHALLSADIRTAYSASDFGATSQAQVAGLGAITDLRRSSISPVEVSPSGISYVVAGYSVTRRRPDGQLTTGSYDAYLVYDDGGWKLWFTAPR